MSKSTQRIGIVRACFVGLSRAFYRDWLPNADGYHEGIALTEIGKIENNSSVNTLLHRGLTPVYAISRFLPQMAVLPIWNGGYRLKLMPFHDYAGRRRPIPSSAFEEQKNWPLRDSAFARHLVVAGRHGAAGNKSVLR